MENVPPRQPALLQLILDWYSHHPHLSNPRKFPDQRMEYHALCPYHADRHFGSFSFSERGYYCFACGAKGSLRALGQDLTGASCFQGIPGSPAPETRPKKLLEDFDYLASYLALSDRAQDYLFKRGFLQRTIEMFLLREGRVNNPFTLPDGRVLDGCTRPRITYPWLTSGHGITGVKGRTYWDGCPHAKWLTLKDSQTALFGSERLGEATGRTVIVTESPFAVMLVHQDEPDLICVAGTSGCGCFLPEWVDQIKQAHPSHLVFWFDNDPPGAKAAYQHALLFQDTPIPVSLFQWPSGLPQSYDLADYRRAHDLLPAVYQYAHRLNPSNRSHHAH